MTKSIAWTEQLKFPGHNSTLLIDANSYNEWVKDTCYVCSEDVMQEALSDTVEGIKKYGVTQVGKYNFHLKSLPTEVHTFSLLWGSQIKQSKLSVRQGKKQAYVAFSNKVIVPVLGEIRGPLREERVWMSLTPFEVFSLRAGIKRSQGRVLIAGLGMGWLTTRILEKKSVKHVTQIELNPDIVNFFGKPLLQSFGSKLDIVVEDVYTHLGEVGADAYDSIIFDIWPAYGSAKHDKRFQTLKKQHARVWGWGDVDLY